MYATAPIITRRAGVGFSPILDPAPDPYALGNDHRLEDSHAFDPSHRRFGRRYLRHRPRFVDFRLRRRRRKPGPDPVPERVRGDPDPNPNGHADRRTHDRADNGPDCDGHADLGADDRTDRDGNSDLGADDRTDRDGNSDLGADDRTHRDGNSDLGADDGTNTDDHDHGAEQLRCVRLPGFPIGRRLPGLRLFGHFRRERNWGDELHGGQFEFITGGDLSGLQRSDVRCNGPDEQHELRKRVDRGEGSVRQLRDVARDVQPRLLVS